MTRYLVSGLGVAIALGFMAVSAVMSWRYGMSLGRDAIDRYAYAMTHILGDGLKAALPFFFWWSMRNRIWAVTTASGVLWVLCTVYSLSALLGYADMNRQMTAGTLATRADLARDLRREVERRQEQLGALGAQDAAGAIERRLEGLRQHAHWTASKSCSEARGGARTFCIEYSNLTASLSRAQEIERLEQEIAGLREKLAGAGGAARLERSGDPQAGAVVRLTGWELVKVQTGLSLLLVAMLELGSSFGLFVALNHGELRGEPARRPGSRPAERDEVRRGEAVEAGRDEIGPGGVSAFATSRLRQSPGKSVALDAVLRHYRSWCDTARRNPLPRESFEIELRAWLAAQSVAGNELKVERSGNRVYCRGVQLAT